MEPMSTLNGAQASGRPFRRPSGDQPSHRALPRLAIAWGPSNSRQVPAAWAARRPASGWLMPSAACSTAGCPPPVDACDPDGSPGPFRLSRVVALLVGRAARARRRWRSPPPSSRVRRRRDRRRRGFVQLARRCSARRRARRRADGRKPTAPPAIEPQGRPEADELPVGCSPGACVRRPVPAVA